MSDIQACETVCPCVDICEIARLRAEVDDLKRINMNLRYLIPEAVWMDEADRLRGDNQESPANEIERLRDEVKRLGGLIFTYVNEKHNDDLWAHDGLSANATARQSSAVRTSNAYAALVDEYRSFHP